MGNVPPEMRVEGYPKPGERKAVEKAVQTEEKRCSGNCEGRGKETTHSTILTKSSTPKPSAPTSKSVSHNSSRPKRSHVSPEPPQLLKPCLPKHVSPEPGVRTVRLDYTSGLTRTYTEAWIGRTVSPELTHSIEKLGKTRAVRVSLTTQGDSRRKDAKIVRKRKDVSGDVKKVTVSLTEGSSKRQIGHKTGKPKPLPRALGTSTGQFTLSELALVEQETVRQMFRTRSKAKETVSLRTLSPNPLQVKHSPRY